MGSRLHSKLLERVNIAVKELHARRECNKLGFKLSVIYYALKCLI